MLYLCCDMSLCHIIFFEIKYEQKQYRLQSLYYTVLRADLGCSVNGNNINTREVCVTSSVCVRCRGDDTLICVMTSLTCLYGGNVTETPPELSAPLSSHSN